MSQESRSSWLIPASEIGPGQSAILGGNTLMFYIIHYVALLLISISLISSVLIVIRVRQNLKIQKNARIRTKMDFSVRVPIYLAITDSLWGISHLGDHIYLIATQTYPTDKATSVLLSINLWVFLGYQQLLHASLAAFVYLKIVHSKTLDLGKGEWRLHLFCCITLGLTVLLFYKIDAFGCSGYWYLENLNSSGGFIMNLTVMAVCTLNACSTTLGYYLIKRKVNEQKQSLNQFSDAAVSNTGFHSTATQCLTTFVRNAAYIYCPFAIIYPAVAIQNYFGVIEPITAFLIVIVADSSGWMNAWTFFENEKIKASRLKKSKPAKQLESGTNSLNTDTTSV